VKQCPFCMGQVPDAALKCQHCGEWLDGRASGGESELGRAANRYINLKIAMTVIGLILALLFFFLIWLPGWNKAHRDFDNFPSFPSSTK
jgi:uncharacterized membrane protein YvbJ